MIEKNGTVRDRHVFVYYLFIFIFSFRTRAPTGPIHGSFDSEHTIEAATADRCTCLYASTCFDAFNFRFRANTFFIYLFIFYYYLFFLGRRQIHRGHRSHRRFGMRRYSLTVKCCKHGCGLESVCLVTDLCDVGTYSRNLIYIYLRQLCIYVMVQ